MVTILDVLIVIILVEAITNILTKSEFFEPVRKFLFESDSKILNYVHRIVDCPYCTSVWVGIGCMFLLYLYKINFIPMLIILICVGIVIHRLANIMHHVIDRIDSNHVGLDKENKTL